MQDMGDKSLVAVSSLREFFRDAFHAATERQKLEIEEQSEQYVVNLLTMFSRADALYEKTPEGLRIRPLAHMLAEALDAPSAAARQRALQRLGDVSLFIAGFFARSFARKLVDIDYHIAMGGNAYGSLADSMQRSASSRAIGAIYAVASDGSPQVIVEGRLVTIPAASVTAANGKISTSLTKKEVVVSR